MNAPGHDIARRIGADAEVLPPEWPEEPAITLTNNETWAIWDYFQSHEGPHYWEDGRLASIAAKCKMWIKEYGR